MTKETESLGHTPETPPGGSARLDEHLRVLFVSLVRKVVRLALTYRRTTSVALHTLLILLSNFLAFQLRFDSSVPPNVVQAARQTAVLLVLVRSAVFVPFRLYEGLWRYASIWDLSRIILGVLASSAVFYGIVRWVMPVQDYPRSVMLIDAMLLIVFMGGARMGRRILNEARSHAGTRRVLVFGAGNAGEMIVRDMLRSPDYGSTPIGFIDDDAAKVGKRIHGVPVVGTRKDLTRYLVRHKPDEILIAVPSESPASIRQIAASLRAFKIPISTLPSISEIVAGTVTVSQIRPLAIEDLLARAPVGLDRRPVEELIAGRRVLVTGAGGSIGSELCRQIAALEPASLALVERYENSLHFITVELEDRGYGPKLKSYLADITDRIRISSVFSEFKPEIVFHAAAHKHVPVVEANPSEGLKNNVLGTRTVAEEAARVGVSRFVLISTDKAVNPTNVMGATKRVAEFCIQAMRPGSTTAFSAVRFGNVLGSNGSVVPRFLEQIKAGGPVTVTHPEIRRFFMLIPEAVQLVLHAAAQAERGGTYVLEMGDQVNVAEMARNLIRLMGFIPDKEIQLEFVGLRPGEKLYEELVGIDEVAEPSGIHGIHRVRPMQAHEPHETVRLIDHAIAAALQGHDKRVLELLQEIVPTYRPATNDRPAAHAKPQEHIPGVVVGNERKLA